MNINTDKEIMVFRKDGEYGPMYSVGLSKKNQSGEYENGYMPARFRKDEELDNRTPIYIKEAWISFNLKDKKTYPYIFINKYETIDNKVKPTKELFEEKDPYSRFGEENEELYTDLPF